MWRGQRLTEASISAPTLKLYGELVHPRLHPDNRREHDVRIEVPLCRYNQSTRWHRIVASNNHPQDRVQILPSSISTHQIVEIHNNNTANTSDTHKDSWMQPLHPELQSPDGEAKTMSITKTSFGKKSEIEEIDANLLLVE